MKDSMNLEQLLRWCRTHKIEVDLYCTEDDHVEVNFVDSTNRLRNGTHTANFKHGDEGLVKFMCEVAYDMFVEREAGE
tara:strand:+ start:22976 stop:23209 length:234 start_codon:yes stop_codon:yes gene_type:complete